MSDEREQSVQEIVKELLVAFSGLKQKMEDPSFIQLENSISQLINNQKDMREDLGELKKRLLNPYDGAIVEIRKNTEWRQEQEKVQKENEKIIEEHKALMRWKNNMQKVGIGILTSAGAIITWLISEFLIK
jgi:hypothetical protein